MDGFKVRLSRHINNGVVERGSAPEPGTPQNPEENTANARGLSKRMWTAGNTKWNHRWRTSSKPYGLRGELNVGLYRMRSRDRAGYTDRALITPYLSYISVTTWQDSKAELYTRRGESIIEYRSMWIRCTSKWRFGHWISPTLYMFKATRIQVAKNQTLRFAKEWEDEE